MSLKTNMWSILRQAVNGCAFAVGFFAVQKLYNVTFTRVAKWRAKKHSKQSRKQTLRNIIYKLRHYSDHKTWNLNDEELAEAAQCAPELMVIGQLLHSVSVDMQKLREWCEDGSPIDDMSAT